MTELKFTGIYITEGFPGGSDHKESSCNVEDPGLISRLGRSPGGGQGTPLQHSCLESPWTEEPGGLQSMGPQRVGHNWSDLAHTHILQTDRKGKSRGKDTASQKFHTSLVCLCSTGQTGVTGMLLVVKEMWNPWAAVYRVPFLREKENKYRRTISTFYQRYLLEDWICRWRFVPVTQAILSLSTAYTEILQDMWGEEFCSSPGCKQCCVTGRRWAKEEDIPKFRNRAFYKRVWAK